MHRIECGQSFWSKWYRQRHHHRCRCRSYHGRLERSVDGGHQGSSNRCGCWRCPLFCIICYYLWFLMEDLRERQTLPSSVVYGGVVKPEVSTSVTMAISGHTGLICFAAIDSLVHLWWWIKVNGPFHHRSGPRTSAAILSTPGYDLPATLSANEDPISAHPLLFESMLGYGKPLVWHTRLEKRGQVRRASSLAPSHIYWHDCDMMAQTINPIAHKVR
mmetsp:Transcript_21932/g.50092  ORF Transcript_21932/g.50092 Transcript_21932/m.50092 type:complete len:217 (+) Transcript_21932:2-652(+)